MKKSTTKKKAASRKRTTKKKAAGRKRTGTMGVIERPARRKAKKRK